MDTSRRPYAAAAGELLQERLTQTLISSRRVKMISQYDLRRISGKIVAIDRVILGVNWPARPAFCQELAGKLTGNCPSSMRHLFDQLGGKGPAGMASCWRPAGMASCWRPAGVLLAWRLAGVLLASGRHGILLALCWPGRHATCLQLGSGASSLAFDRRDCSP